MMSSRKRRNTIVKTIAITLIAGTISFAGDITISNADEVNTGVVKQCDFLNMRSGASTSNSVVGKVNTGDSVQIIEKSSNGWYKIKTVGNVTGWVNGRYITESGSVETNTQNSSEKVQSLLNLAYKQSGKPYKWGASGPSAFDCSGFTSYVYRNAVGISIPRTSSAQSGYGTTVSKSNLQPGDLVFFSTNGTGRVSHVGIYVGGGNMVHAPSSGKTISVTSINSSYYTSRFVTAKRVL